MANQFGQVLQATATPAREGANRTGQPAAHGLRHLPSWRAMSGNRTAAAATLLLMLIGVAALLAPVIAPSDPTRVDLQAQSLAPSWPHPLGTDQLGRDMLSRAIYGARVSLGIGLAAAAIAAILGVSLGVTAGYLGGWVNVVVTRLVDASLAVPAFFLLIALQSLFGGSIVSVMLIVPLVGWTAVARVVRSETLSLSRREFVLAAVALGCSRSRIILRHLLPNLAPQVAVLFALGVADALLIESALSFMGMGVPPVEPSWGNMLSDARAAILSGAWWEVAFPGLLIMTTAAAINLLGDRAAGFLDMWQRMGWDRELGRRRAESAD